MGRIISLCFSSVFLFAVCIFGFAIPANSGEKLTPRGGGVELALKTKPPSCVPVLCWKQNVGWCMCDPCAHVVDCRAATGGRAKPKAKG